MHAIIIADDGMKRSKLEASNFQIQDDRMTWWPHEVEMVAELPLVARHHGCHHKTRGIAASPTVHSEGGILSPFLEEDTTWS